MAARIHAASLAGTLQKAANQPDTHEFEHAAARRLRRTLFLVIGGWLGAAACVVQMEYYDGWSAVANARYLLGMSDHYVSDRAPMMAVLLTPAELVRTALGWHPLDVRAHHAWLALLHVAYLIAVYRLLRRVGGESWGVLAAWTAAIPNFVFFSYSPFISHDILPGVLLLWMLVWADRFATRHSFVIWVELVALGAIAALFKQTFGFFWILLLLSALFQCRRSNDKEARETFLGLMCGAFASGAITWLVLGAILGNTDPGTPLLVRPLRNLQYLSSVYEGMNVRFPLWIYLRNAPAYGWLACLLVLPGWVLSMRGTRLQQSIAVAWLGGLICLHVLPLREVRYIAFLAPLTACLLVPAIHLVCRRRLMLIAALLLLAIDVGRCTLEAARIFHPFYTSGTQRRFFDLLDDPLNRNRPVVVNTPMLNFVAPFRSPFAADRYHRIFHFGIAHLRHIYGCRDLRIIADAQTALDVSAGAPDGSLLFYANQILARGPSWSSGAPVGQTPFIQCVAVCRTQRVAILETGADVPPDARAVRLVRPPAGVQTPLKIQGEACVGGPWSELLPLLQIEATGASYWLERVAPDAFTVSGMPFAETIVEPQQGLLRWFEIDRLMSSGSGN